MDPPPLQHHKAAMRGYGSRMGESSSSISSSSAAATAGLSSGSGSGSGSGPWLDPRLWGTLPPKLLERIMACLPPASIFRMRLLCKWFYRLMFSDSFLELCAEAAPFRPWFLLLRRGRWAEPGLWLDPENLAWHRAPPLEALPPVFSVSASAGGLLCCLSDSAGCKTVLICNPLTRECLQLPGTLKQRFAPSVGLLVERERHRYSSSPSPSRSCSYKVMMAGDDMISPFAVKNLTTEMYDSALQFWNITAPLPRLCNLEQSGRMIHVQVQGKLYCMNYTPFAVLVYDLQRAEWSKIQAPMRRFLRSPSLVECQGGTRLLMVAAVLKSKLNVPRSIRLWELQQQHQQSSSSSCCWVEVERMPQSLHDQFIQYSDDFTCVGHGDFVMLLTAGHGNGASSSSSSSQSHPQQMLVYDVQRKLWRWAPPCPSLLMQQQQLPWEPLRAFAFEPRLDASVC